MESVEVLHPRAARRHEPGPRDLALQLTGQTVAAVERRGKYLWLVLDPTGLAVVVHLGMSGQMLVQPPTVADEKHLRIRAVLDSGATYVSSTSGPSEDGLSPRSSRSTVIDCRCPSPTSHGIRWIRGSIRPRW